MAQDARAIRRHVLVTVLGGGRLRYDVVNVLRYVDCTMTTPETAQLSAGASPTARAVAEPAGYDRGRRESIGLVFFWLIVLMYAYFIPSIVSWNAESHLYTTYAIVDRHTVRIDHYHQGLGDQSYANGHYYSDKAPGMAFLAAPIYALMRLVLPQEKAQGYVLYKHRAGYYYIRQDMVNIRYVITYFLLILPSAALAVLVWLFFCRLTGSVGWSLLLAGAFALGTVAYIYSVWLFSHQLVSVLLFSSFLLVFYRVKERPDTGRTLLFAAAAGVLGGLAIITEYPTIIIAGLIGLYLLAVARSKVKTALAYAVSMAPAAALNVGYNVVAFGKPFATSYLYVHSGAFQSHVHGGFLGLANPFSYAFKPPTLNSIYQITFGGYRGIFLISPVLILFVAGAFFMWRRRELRAEWWLCLAVVVLYFLMDASRGTNTNGWSGGSSVASRHLTPMIPFMFIPIAYVLGHRLGRVAFVVLAAVSVAMQCMIVMFTGLFPYNDLNPIVNEVLPNFAAAHVQTNWVYVWRDVFNLMGLSSLLPLLVLTLLLVGWLIRLVRAEARAASPTRQALTEEAAH